MCTLCSSHCEKIQNTVVGRWWRTTFDRRVLVVPIAINVVHDVPFQCKSVMPWRVGFDEWDRHYRLHHYAVNFGIPLIRRHVDWHNESKRDDDISLRVTIVVQIHRVVSSMPPVSHHCRYVEIVLLYTIQFHPPYNQDVIAIVLPFCSTTTSLLLWYYSLFRCHVEHSRCRWWWLRHSQYTMDVYQGLESDISIWPHIRDISPSRQYLRHMTWLPYNGRYRCHTLALSVFCCSCIHGCFVVHLSRHLPFLNVHECVCRPTISYWWLSFVVFVAMRRMGRIHSIPNHHLLLWLWFLLWHHPHVRNYRPLTR